MSSCTTRVLNAATQGLQQCEVQPVQQRTHSRTSRHWYTYTTSARAPSRLAALDAAMKPTFTLGIEEEYQTVDPETRDLRSHIHAEIIEKGKLVLVERASLIFGLHVHVGIEDRETLIQMMNHARYFVPHLLALSSNSPFWLGMDTGLKSYRCKVFDKFPRTNMPDYFPSLGEYDNYVKLLIK